MAELNIHLDLRLGARSARWAMIGAMLFALAPELASESVTLTTYYPAPSGVYTQMIATGNTYSARDAGFLDVGTATTPNAAVKMSVNGVAIFGTSAVNAAAAPAPAGTEVMVNGGNLSVQGSGGGNINLFVNGRMQTGDGGNAGGVWLDSTDTMFVGQDATSAAVWTAGYGWSLQQAQNGFVGVGASPSYPLDVTAIAGNNDIRVPGIKVTNCDWEAFTNSGVTTCLAGAANTNVISYYNTGAANPNPDPIYVGGNPIIGVDSIGNGANIYTTGFMLCCRIHP